MSRDSCQLCRETRHCTCHLHLPPATQVRMQFRPLRRGSALGRPQSVRSGIESVRHRIDRVGEQMAVSVQRQHGGLVAEQPLLHPALSMA